MKKINLARIIWVTCLFLVLIIILIMVMDYKIHYQDLQYHRLYFYECDAMLCVSEVKDNSKLIYSKYECGYEECPIYQKELEDSYALLKEGQNTILWDYRQAKIISQDYEDYQFINSNYIIVTKDNAKGVINLENRITTNLLYEEIGDNNEEYLSGYNIQTIIAKKDGKYGIISYKDGSIVEKFEYSEEDKNKLLEMIHGEEEK